MSEFKIKLSNIKDRFGNEKDAHFYLASRRWKDGEIHCPHCGHENYYVFGDGIRYKCKGCKLIFNAKTNTFMEASKLPTYKWIYGMYLVMQKKGISSVQLAEILEIQQRSAWFLLQRLRWAMGNEDNSEPMSGAVSADCAVVGGANKNRHWDKKVEYVKGMRAYPDKSTVLGMADHTGYLRTFIVTREAKEFVNPLILSNVEDGSVLVTDEYSIYKELKVRYDHKICSHAHGQYAKDGYSSNNVENFWSHLKRGLRGIYIQVSKKHLDKYLFEFQFRHNNRKLDISERIGVIVDRMVCRLKYKDLIA